MSRTREQQPIPVTARSILHYWQVFPNLFGFRYQGRGLIIGSGFGNAALHPRWVAVEPGLVNVSGMFSNLKDVGAPDQKHSLNAILNYLDDLENGEQSNTQLVAGKLEPNGSLPFAPESFNDIVSSNCLFGNLEVIWGAQTTAQAILGLKKYLQPGGKLHLFPFFVGKEGTPAQFFPTQEYQLLDAITIQQAVIASLAGDFLIDISTRVTDPNPLNPDLGTATLTNR